MHKMSENNKQTLKDVMAELEADLSDKLELQAERIQHLERDYGQVLEDYTAVQERVKQLEERLESSQTCSTSAAESDRAERSLPSQAAPSGQWEQVLSRVSRLTDCKMQDQDLADQEARKKKEVNAVLRNLRKSKRNMRLVTLSKKRWMQCLLKSLRRLLLVSVLSACRRGEAMLHRVL